MRDAYSRLLLLVVALLLSGVCAAQRGKISNGTYVSPLNNFSIPVPRGIDSRMWNVKDDVGVNQGAVAFTDPFGGFYNIFYLSLSEETLKIQSDPEKQRANLARFLSDAAMPGLFKPTVPGANVLHEEHIDAGEHNAYFAIVDLPEGSTMYNAATKKQYDTKRGLLVFVQGPFIYMLGAGEYPNLLNALQPPKTLDKLKEDHKRSLLSFKSRITFKQ